MSNASEVPDGGWTIREAADALLTEPHQFVLAAALKAAELQDDMRSVNHFRSVLWGMLREKIARGTATITGFVPGTTAPAIVNRDFALDASPDFDANTLTLGTVVYHGVRVRKVDENQGVKMTVQQARKPSVNYKEADRLLVEEMRRLITAGTAKGPQDAARMVADRAQGKGNSDSKVKRLTGAFNRSGQSGQY